MNDIPSIPDRLRADALERENGLVGKSDGPATEHQAADKIERLLAALAEISKGAGPFSMDPTEHAENCIEAMKKLANKALGSPSAEGEKDD